VNTWRVLAPGSSSSLRRLLLADRLTSRARNLSLARPCYSLHSPRCFISRSSLLPSTSHSFFCDLSRHPGAGAGALAWSSTGGSLAGRGAHLLPSQPLNLSPDCSSPWLGRLCPATFPSRFFLLANGIPLDRIKEFQEENGQVHERAQHRVLGQTSNTIPGEG